MTLRVQASAVTKTYGSVRALAGVSVELVGGTITVVEGANGSGKSTLLGVLGTLVRPTSGAVDFGRLGASRADVRRQLGWVAHESLCYGDLSGAENIAFAAHLHGVPVEQALARAADRFELDAFVDRPLRTYSRGQRQRIALARALVHTPNLLLLDEPSTGLDGRSVERLVVVAREEAARGAVVVVVTHDRALTEALGGSVIRMDRGRRVA
jgi:heme exporter protein A